MREPVKGASDAGRRREQRARATRRRVVAAARALFEDRGYAGTTVVDVAAAAGVAPATVYQAFGTKQAILARVLDEAVAGDDEPAALRDRAWVQQMRALEDPRQRLWMLVRHTSEVAVRTAPLKQVMRDASASEPEVRALIEEDHRRRLETQTALLELAVGAGPLRPGLGREQAAATYFALVSSDGYLLMSRTLGWDLARWRRWLLELLSHELLGADVAAELAD